jgi:hypothetical protein
LLVDEKGGFGLAKARAAFKERRGMAKLTKGMICLESQNNS